MVAEYIRGEFGYRRMKQFIKEVRDTTKMLRRAPNIGKIDPLFEDRPMAYRSVIINGLSKLVYRVEDDIIHIVGFWDTRMDDENQASQVK
jgi:plasmid stabilization system protein ParE